MADEDDEQMLQVKAVLIGESGTGKTSIINRLKTNEFNSTQDSTMCSSMFRKVINIPDFGSLMVEIWDTAGQEKYRSINKLFYKDSNIVIFVYDITNKKSFDEIKNYWFEQVKENCDLNKIILGVAANKCDLFNKEEVKEDDGKTFANRIKGAFQSTSCFTGIGINDLFNQVGLLYVKKTNGVVDPTPKPKPLRLPNAGKKPKKCCK